MVNEIERTMISLNHLYQPIEYFNYDKCCIVLGCQPSTNVNVVM